MLHLQHAPVGYYVPRTAGRGALAAHPGGSHPRKWEAYALLGSGLVTAAGILLYFNGKPAAAGALGVFAALGAAAIGAIRVLSSPVS